MSNIIPFGKYKGLELSEVCITDPNYIEWLKSQNWLNGDLKQQIININMNGINGKQDSPEHNKLQIFIFNNAEKIFKNNIWKKEIEYKSGNFFFDLVLWFGEEQDFYGLHKTILIEIKPFLSDDFMDNIRQIEKYKESWPGKHFYLIFENFNVSNLDIETVKKIFKSKEINLIHLSKTKQLVLKNE